MSNQSPSTSYMTNCSVTDNIGFKPIETFKWTDRLEKYLLLYMKRLNPSGINKHLSMLLLKEKMSKKFKLDIPIKVLWEYVSTKWDIKFADRIENIRFDTNEKDFVLPEDFDQLIKEEGEKIKNLKKECLNDEINERKLLNWSGKTRSNFNSMPSVDSKEDLNEMTSSTLLESSPAKTNEVILDDVPCTSRSLRTKNKLEDSKSDEKNKSKDLKQLKKKTSNKSKSMEEIEKISNIRVRKRESSHVSESSFTSDNSKRLRNYKNNSTDSTISNRLSRSVSPDMLRGKISTRSITLDNIYKKSNLRSSDKDHKSILPLEKACLNFGYAEVQIESLKPENQFASLMEAKTKNLMHSKYEANNKVRAKIRKRVTSDLLVVQQSPEKLSLGRRSCSKKKKS